MHSTPAAVVFDFGGTLIHNQFDVAAGQRRMLELAHGQPVDAVTYAALAAEIDADLVGRRTGSLLEHSATSFTRLMGDCLGIAFSQSPQALELEFWKASQTCELIPGVHAVIGELKRAGLLLGVASNMTFTGAVIDYELVRFGLRDHFSAIVTSADYGIRKPHPLVFKGIAGRLRVQPSDCWYIGDRIDFDVAGSQSAGMRGIWLNREKKPGLAGVLPDGELTDWSEFASLWARLGG